MATPSDTTPPPCWCPLLDTELSEQDATAMAAQLKALADPVRLRLLSAMANAPAAEVCTCDLPELVDRSQATVSHHLGILTKAGLIEREQRGKWAWFRLRRDQLDGLGAAIISGGNHPGSPANGFDNGSETPRVPDHIVGNA